MAATDDLSWPSARPWNDRSNSGCGETSDHTPLRSCRRTCISTRRSASTTSRRPACIPSPHHCRYRHCTLEPSSSESSRRAHPDACRNDSMMATMPDASSELAIAVYRRRLDPQAEPFIHEQTERLTYPAHYLSISATTPPHPNLTTLTTGRHSTQLRSQVLAMTGRARRFDSALHAGRPRQFTRTLRPTLPRFFALLNGMHSPYLLLSTATTRRSPIEQCASRPGAAHSTLQTAGTWQSMSLGFWPRRVP